VNLSGFRVWLGFFSSSWFTVKRVCSICDRVNEVLAIYGWYIFGFLCEVFVRGLFLSRVDELLKFVANFSVFAEW